MITNSSAYYSLLNWQAKLNLMVTSGNTAALDPSMLAMGVAWAAAMITKAQATETAFINATAVVVTGP